MDAREFFKTRPGGTRHYFFAKLYVRMVAASSARGWEECRDAALETAVELLKETRIQEREVAEKTLKQHLRSREIDSDREAVLDVLRLACAIGRIAMIPIMEPTNGYPSEAFVSLTVIEELSELRFDIAEVLEKMGWIDCAGLRNVAKDSHLAMNDDSARLVLAHAAARGLGEYDRRGLFYRRPFLKNST